MNDDIEQGWPPYRAGHGDHYLALGVIISLFNDLEFQLFGIFLPLGLGICQSMFLTLRNNRRNRSSPPGDGG